MFRTSLRLRHICQRNVHASCQAAVSGSSSERNPDHLHPVFTPSRKLSCSNKSQKSLLTSSQSSVVQSHHAASPIDTNHRVGRLLKTHSCNCLRASDVGTVVKLRGFLAFSRHKKFLLLRDSHGLTQVLVPQEKDLLEVVERLTYESYLEVSGTVKLRQKGQENPALDTGEIEVEATHLKVLSKAPASTPFLIRPHNKPKESLGLQYRYLQLRFPQLIQNLRLRSQVSKLMTCYLQDVEGFVNVTTPTFAAPTSGGAHLFPVPYAGDCSSDSSEHISPGNQQQELDSDHDKGSIKSDGDGSKSSSREYYSMAQSPQTYKQLLMLGGLDKYYQFAICYRDERTTPDRQPEFMQLDLEMSDVTVSEVRLLIERLLQHSWPEDVAGPFPAAPFPSITYRQAMDLYGCDKPDTRFGWQLQDVTAALREGCTATRLTASLDTQTVSARAFVVPQAQKQLSKKLQDSWEQLAHKEHGIPGVSFLTVQPGGGMKGALARHLTDPCREKLIRQLEAGPGDVVVMAVGDTDTVLKCLGRLRLLAASTLEQAGVQVRDAKQFNFLWVVDFPLFEVGEDGVRLESVHHPFTLPHPDDLHLLKTVPLQCRSQHFDLVCNGCEVGGGSERIHDSELQEQVLDLLQLPLDEMRYFIEALAMGAPPHAGIALGFDRLMALLCGAESIREVMAFPKNSSGRCPMTGSPASVSDAVKQRYGLL